MTHTPAMLELSRPTRLFRHTLHTAIPALLELGVDLDQIAVLSAGAGWPRGTVVRQTPAAGTTLRPTSRVELFVAGGGTLDSLPYAMRADDPEGFAADAFCRLFDSPLGKLQQHVAMAGGYFALHPDEPRTALRWIRDIFQLDDAGVPADAWYGLALLLPALHRLGGTTRGVALGMRIVFGLTVSDVDLTAGVAPLPEGRHTLLGTRNGRLGIDAVIGRGVTTASDVLVTYGPVSLNAYLLHAGHQWQRARRRILALILPASITVIRERWRVEAPVEGTRISSTGTPALLGVNSRLGAGGMGLV